ncbi:phosphoglucomutase (alpha-D-glucose-1,6-bisphosphate-dependent) [Pseudidiomarina sp.]|uniref:phosphoglucomutase (alpha-D-glucose-1,6-bisphosphate-dependent) n=1 Tax=Pseudidiomarina sp. TaxID=2081707 RepID=UPI00299D73B9|nr:phosphoglucomutase (alpha-D-glucose-1,6-bisphosphate-dependent) [Pseudidiomarina sp.]MDX1705699.1 phosphoglucomutase (alpha-D-glucose-1,6-bisphosphate-dependent) [Pseudidiomarina sp.]
MALHERAGQPAQAQDLTNIAQLISAYFVNEVDPRNPAEQVKFGTSGHRGSALQNSFNEAHILAMSQALVAYREEQHITGPLLLGKDTHALSEAAFMTALEVFIGNDIEVHIQSEDGYTPTPVISHAILRYNRGRSSDLCDGVVITPSHNPPADGGFKYNPPHGGPADTDATKVIEKYANALLTSELAGVQAVSYGEARGSKLCREVDWRQAYIDSLAEVIDMESIAKADIRIGVDALGGAGASYWDIIARQYDLNIEVHHQEVDASFRFMTLDKDGKIRMDCSSPYAMASLLKLKEHYAVAVGNDPDYDRHGIVTPTHGLLNPNHYLAVAIDYLCRHRDWHNDLAIGKTLVSSAMIDRVVTANNRKLREMPVGFKWFAQELHQGITAFAGEESAGATFLDRQGQPWSTDKDGIILALLAAEICATTGKNPGEYYDELCRQHGTSYYQRVDVPSSAELNAAFGSIRAYKLKLESLAGDEVTAVMTKAPANDALIGGVKVTTANGWFAARPSGTEPVYKIYSESFVSAEHLQQLAAEAEQLVNQWLQG